MKKIHVYYRVPPEKDRLVPGDRYLATLLKKLFKRTKMSGVRKVFLNLRKSFEALNVDFDVNLPFKKILPGEPVIILGDGKYALEGYDKPNPVIAGIGLMTHPADWPDLCTIYPVVRYLQHSEWTNNIYKRFYGAEVCTTWPAGIETEKWKPVAGIVKKTDILIYTKILWDTEQTRETLLPPILKKLDQLNLSHREIIYGQYQEGDYHSLLSDCQAMIYLCEHESQGFALLEALSMDVPVLAWDQGYWLDPERFAWGDAEAPASSVPFFDERCGAKFKTIEEFEAAFNTFWGKVQSHDYSPRNYVLENLTLEKSGQRMLDIVSEVYGE
jgi:hypothetical protein